MQTLRQIKNRIRSIENTRKITRAMQMISSVKLTRSKAAFRCMQTFSGELERLLYLLATEPLRQAHPLCVRASGPTKTGAVLVLIASDSGLCGTYNHAVLDATEKFVAGRQVAPVRVIAVGQEAAKFARKAGLAVEQSFVRLFGTFKAPLSDEICRSLRSLYVSGAADEVLLARMRFSSSLRHQPAVEPFLPIALPPATCAAPPLTEPETNTLFDAVVNDFLIYRMRAIMLESFTAEHSARMLAMKNATDNATEMIDTLTLQRNKARQAAITQEVLEIANAAEALKG